MSSEDLPRLRMALLNARSVVNKTVIINNFFSLRELYLLFITESWCTTRELSTFSELLPPKCLFFNLPRKSGCGGGLVSIFKDTFSCWSTVINDYQSFELQLFTLDLNFLLLVALIYCPPKHNTNFFNEFADFLGEFTPKYDKLLILGDFNVHVCCTGDPLAK